jgi:hypothetical protein
MTDVLTVVQECADFSQWKTAHDAAAPNRKAAGLTDLMLLRQQKKPNVVALILGVGDRAKAQAMIDSQQPRSVIGAPVFHLRFGEFTTPAAPLYLSINCRIRDIATFHRGFALDQADRAAATLGDLGVLQNAADPHDLLIVCSVGDQAKVKAFLSLPALSAHQIQSAGVISTPVFRYWVPD